ncbi:DUF481 domain-containing protein [Silvibacterium dinghuense]|nr:DUF481 domain-containing protein [Silvibacterium dinghuense]
MPIAVVLVAGSLTNGWIHKAFAQAATSPDVLTLSNGDQLRGKLVSETAGTVTFHSDGAGDLTLSWDKIKSIQTTQHFAVIQQGQHLSRKNADSDVPKGAVAIQNGNVQVGPEGQAKEIPQANVQYMVDAAAYDKEVHSHPGWGQGWNGTLSAGLADVEATQNSRTFTGAANFIRTVPTVSWLDPRYRTMADFAAAYGSLSQPGTVTTKTNIIHAGAEQDWFLSSRLYALADVSFDHNYSQGLSLQQIYGGGLGFVAYKSPREELDLKGDIHYERQNFGYTPGVVPEVKTPDKDLIGADAGDAYMVKLVHGIVLNQGLTVTPAFNTPSAWSALATAGLAFPVYKRLGFNLSALDDFLNDPAYGSKKNSFQFSAGITYTLK